MLARLGLLFTAFIWGLSFVVQRQVTSCIGPFAFNFIRFFIAAGMLVPVSKYIFETKPTLPSKYSAWYGGALCGFFMFTGAVLQQAGLAHTTASKTAFITALYIVIVPICGLFFNHRLSFLAVLGVSTSVYGTILLTNVGSASLNYGDFLILCSSFCWAAQILAMAYFAPRHPCIKISAIQFFVAGVLNGICTIFFEPLTLEMIHQSLLPILYAGVFTLGIGFTLQTVFQRVLPPTETSLILSTEMIFASICGYFILGEKFSTPEFMGVVFITIGIILAELPCSSKYSIPAIKLNFKKVI